MKRTTSPWIKRISLTATAAILAAGCAAGPQRTPDRTNRTLPQTNVSSTTGDTDSCAVALGNRVASMANNARAARGTVDVTANGVLIGNVALVALPNAPAAGTAAGTPATGAQTGSTPATGAPTTGSTDGAAAGTGAPNLGTPAAGTPGTTAAGTPAPGTPAGAAATGIGAAGQGIAGAARRFGAAVPAPAAPATPGGGAATATPAPATTATPAAPTTPTQLNTPDTAAGAQAAAVERIKMACDRVADIRVVNTDADRQRLSEITYAIRNGHPITEFMTDLNRMAQAATSVGAGRNANRGPGIAPSPTAAR